MKRNESRDRDTNGTRSDLEPRGAFWCFLALSFYRSLHFVMRPRYYDRAIMRAIYRSPLGIRASVLAEVRLIPRFRSPR